MAKKMKVTESGEGIEGLAFGNSTDEPVAKRKVGYTVKAPFEYRKKFYEAGQDFYPEAFGLTLDAAHNELLENAKSKNGTEHGIAFISERLDPAIRQMVAERIILPLKEN